MKLSKKLITLVVALIVSMFAFTGFSLAANETNGEYELGVMLKQDEANEKVVHVILGMSDEDSIASFQLGLSIDVAEEVNEKFDFNARLSESQYKESRISNETNSEGKKSKRLNIYYTGTKELNPVESNELEIGTITFEGADQPNTTIKIKSVENFSTVASVSHKDTPITVDTFDTIFNKKENNLNENNNSDNSNGYYIETVNPENNDKGGNVINKFINSIKTGANKSVTWIIITIIILVVIAIIIIKLKNKQMTTKKHTKKH